MPKDELSGKNLDNVNLSDSDLSASDFSNSSLRRAQLKHAKLQDADLSGTNLHGAQLNHADVTGADLGNADLTDASLTGVDLDRAANTAGITLAGATGLPEGMGERATNPAPTAPRWEGDTQGHGKGAGRWIVPDVEHLLAELVRPDWVAEEPDHHLQPRLQEACVGADSPWTLDSYLPTAEAYVVTVSWNRPNGALRDLRADAFALIGTIAESVTFVHQTRSPTAVEYRIVTGMLADDGPFASHGHVILLRVEGHDVSRLLHS